MSISQESVTAELLRWMEEFVEQPHPSLGGWPPCPYARQARLSRSIDVRPGVDPLIDCLKLKTESWDKEVVVFWYDHTKFPADEFLADVEQANQQLLAKDIVVLEDHPDTDEIISGVKMNFGYCAIIVCQQLAKLSEAAEQLKAKGYYDTWTQEDLDKIVTWRHP